MECTVYEFAELVFDGMLCPYLVVMAVVVLMMVLMSVGMMLVWLPPCRGVDKAGEVGVRVGQGQPQRSRSRSARSCASKCEQGKQACVCVCVCVCVVFFVLFWSYAGYAACLCGL